MIPTLGTALFTLIILGVVIYLDLKRYPWGSTPSEEDDVS